MPTYVYQVILKGDDNDEGQVFEVQQKMSDPPLTHHRLTGQPVRRLIQPPHLPGTWTDRQTNAMLSDSNIASKGLTKYVKTSDGRYEKAAGAGPKNISAD